MRRRWLSNRFNSRAREGRDSESLSYWSVRRRFNSRAREGRDPIERDGKYCSDCSFNSRAREGRDAIVYDEAEK